MPLHEIERTVKARPSALADLDGGHTPLREILDTPLLCDRRGQHARLSEAHQA